MPVREKPDDWLEPEIPRQSRVSVEREVGVSHAVDAAHHGAVADGPSIARLSPIEAARQRSGMGHHDRGRRRHKLRFALVFGAITLAMLPGTLRVSDTMGMAPLDETLGSDLLLTGMTVLKVVIAAGTLGAVTWRLRRRASGGRRLAYFTGTWMMALGVGFVAIHENYLAGTVLFDAGAVLLVACAVGDDLIRQRERPSGVPT
jgi:hypothetical protein